MSIYRKFQVIHTFIEPGPDDFAREWTPYGINMLNICEEGASVKINQGQLKELSDTHWIFRYTKNGREQEIVIHMTQERMHLVGGKPPSFPKPRPPKFV